MPRLPQTTGKIETIKQNILDNALTIISEHGLEGFSMRSLAKRLGTTATPIYNYYASKEEIYLKARARGFDILYEEICRAAGRRKDPFLRMRAVTRAFIHFAVSNPQYYKIMLTMDMPMYDKFAGTPLENVAGEVVAASKRLIDYGHQLMEEMAVRHRVVRRGDVQFQYILWITAMHGIVSLYNNAILDGLHDHPEEILDALADRVLTLFQPACGRRRNHK
ncbi:MAG: TetR/AcrR family transcriptional regulator [Deltaproteobacteria bacterium]|nr:TetR/AcrR family transcriptional regulator [Deltaproteobacteria bacterium]